MSQPNQLNRTVQKLLGDCRESYKNQNEQEGGEGQIQFIGEDEQLVIRRSQLKQFAERMARKSWQHQQKIKQLQGEIEQLRQRQKTVCDQLSKQNKNLLEEQQKMIDLLNKKQQMLVSNQRQIQQFVTNRQLEQLNIEQFENTKSSDHYKKIANQFATDKISSKDTIVDSKNRGLKRKIMVGVRKVDFKERKSKDVAQQTHGQYDCVNDLEWAKLKLELCRLLSQLNQLNITNQVLYIQNQHLLQQSELANTRQRVLKTHLYQSYLHLDRPHFNQPACPSHNIHLALNSLATEQQNQKLDIMAPQLAVYDRKTPAQTVAPPITPHFSCSTFGLFSKKNPPDSLSFPCFSDQIFESVSENQSSVRSESFY